MGRRVPLSDEVGALCDIASSSRRHLPKAGRSALLWTAAAMLAMAWAPETRALPDLARPSTGAHHAAAARDFDSAGAAEDGDSEALPPRLGGNDKSVLVAQATVSDPGQSSKREHNWAETLSCEITNAWRDIELLHRLERDRAESLEQGLAAARRDVVSLAALTAEAVEEAARVKQAAQGDAELLNSLQEARERAERLERDLAVARRDAETQTALATKAGEETSRLKAAGEGGAADLQKERGRSGRLEQDLAAARRDTETQTALAAKASEEASRLKGRGGEADLQKERERFARLEQDLAAVRRDVETKTALVTKAGEEASRLIAAGKGGAADLQKERERSARLEQDLAAARRDAETKTALVTRAAEEMARLTAIGKSGAVGLQNERERSARLEQDLAVVRRDVETQTARAAKASEEALLQKQMAEAGAAELKQSRARTDAQAQSLPLSRSAIHAYEAQARKAGNEAAEIGQGTANGAPSLRTAAEAPDRAERPGPNLAPAQGAASDLGTTGSTARDKSIEVAANPVAGRTPAAPVRGAAQPNTEQAAEAAALVARASSLLRQGNIGAARLVLERAVEMASAQASFALAETYDPLVLAKWGTYGTRGDARRAQDLYARADAAGIQGAKSRLDALRR